MSKISRIQDDIMQLRIDDEEITASRKTNCNDLANRIQQNRDEAIATQSVNEKTMGGLKKKQVEHTELHNKKAEKIAELSSISTTLLD